MLLIDLCFKQVRGHLGRCGPSRDLLVMGVHVRRTDVVFRRSSPGVPGRASLRRAAHQGCRGFDMKRRYD